MAVSEMCTRGVRRHSRHEKDWVHCHWSQAGRPRYKSWREASRSWRWPQVTMSKEMASQFYDQKDLDTDSDLNGFSSRFWDNEPTELIMSSRDPEQRDPWSQRGFWPMEPWELMEVVLSPYLLVICYSSCRKLTQQASHHFEAECEKRYMVVDVATGEIIINLPFTEQNLKWECT